MRRTNSSSSALSFQTSALAEQKSSGPQSEASSTAEIRAVDEVSAAIAHRINEPLTALLLYLHEIKDRAGLCAGPDGVLEPMLEMVDNALRETERVCHIMQRVGHGLQTQTDSEIAIAYARDVIGSLAEGETVSDRRGSTSQPLSVEQLLTPREFEVLAMIIGGASNKEGGYRLGISKRTFEVHRAHIMEKLGARNAADLVRMALSKTR